MTVPPSPADMARYRSIVQRTLIDSVVNERTGLTIPCRIAHPQMARDLTVEGMPHYIRFRQWDVIASDPTDIRAGDELVSAVKGTYVLQNLDGPRTFQVSAGAAAIRTRFPDGSLDLFTNADVVFHNPKGSSDTPARVYLYRAAHDLETFPEAAGYTWAVIFDAQIPVTDRWEVKWSGLGLVNSQPRSATLSKPRDIIDLRSCAIAYFLESA